jgi:tetratricopeptide (TPR) repeat protein
MGFAHLQKGDFQKAIEVSRKAIELDPMHIQARNNLAVAHIQADDPAAAIEAAQQTLRINEQFAPAHYNLAVAHRLLGDIPKAKEHYSRAKEMGYPVDAAMEEEWNIVA